MTLPPGTSRRRRRGDAGFSPLALFAASEVGLWYDPSDLTPEKLAWVAANPGFTAAQFLAAFPNHSLFQTAAGDPVTALGQSVGFVLDRRLGPSGVGAQVITNGTFGADSDWTKGTGWSIGSGVATKSAGTASLLSQTVTVTVVEGQRYILRYVLTRSAGSITPRLTGGTTVTGTAQSAAGTYIEILTAVSGNTTFEFSADASFAGTVDNVTLLAIPAGNHAWQATSTARPTLQARANLLTYSEQFDNAAWTKAAATVSANSTVAPDGTTTADTLTATGNYPSASQGASVVVGTVLTHSFWIAKTSGLADGSYPTCSIEYRAGSTPVSEEGIVIDTNTGTGINNSGWGTRNPASFSVVGDGNYWKVTITTQSAPATSTAARVYIGVSGGYANGTRRTTNFPLTSIVVWGADLRLGTSAGTYQRVTTATDYADVGLPRSLTFDGTDDSLVTPSVDFTATDKMTVCAGVFKQSDAATGIVIESSASSASNNGTFQVSAPSGVAANYGFRVAGTGVATYSATTFTAPIVNVLTALLDIAGATIAEEVMPRVNGIVPTLTATDVGPAGTGNFGNYPLFIGRRNQATLPLNGRIHQLIVRGAATDTATIQQTERFVAQKTGVTL